MFQGIQQEAQLTSLKLKEQRLQHLDVAERGLYQLWYYRFLTRQDVKYPWLTKLDQFLVHWQSCSMWGSTVMRGFIQISTNPDKKRQDHLWGSGSSGISGPSNRTVSSSIFQNPQCTIVTWVEMCWTFVAVFDK